MKKRKIYVVTKGRHPGIYFDSLECDKQIKAFPNAQYKIFFDKKEAHKHFDKYIRRSSLKHLKVYIDGSYSDTLNKASFGCVFINDDKKVTTLSGISNMPLDVSLQSVAGELDGAITAIKWAIENSYDSVTIYHDYVGIQKLAEREWDPIKDGTKEYVDFVSNARNSIFITFIKVKAHSGDKYNELADQLAAEVLK